MAVFTPAPEQPDEGYSEDPLNPSFASHMQTASDRSRTPSDLSNFLARQLPHLSLASKKQLAMAVLDHLPTSAIADIVAKLHPRLYIDFVQYVPPEVCLKILEYLDPVSLINVARACRAWYTLAYDRKLWEKLYHLEGWHVIRPEIEYWQERVNKVNSSHLERMRSGEDGHVHKKRAIMKDEEDGDYEMSDAEKPGIKVEEGASAFETSIFGNSAWTQPPSFAAASTPSPEQIGSAAQDVEMESPDKGKSVERAFDFNFQAKQEEDSLLGGKTEKSRESIFLESAPELTLQGLPLSILWSWEPRDKRYIVNWRYLYSMRRRLEKNWEDGKYTNFQFPHPDHPEEGHQECVYSLQFTPEYLVSGSRDQTIRIWSMRTRRLVRAPLVAHTASVLCLQFDADPEEDLIVSGSSDSDVILWKFSTGQVLQRLRKAHSESVLNVKFDKRILVTCSRDKTIKVFNRRPLRYGDVGYPKLQHVNPVPRQMRSYGYEIDLAHELPVVAPYTQIGCLEGHRAAVNAVHICGDEIASASGDKHIKLWDWPKGYCKRTFLGHGKGIACVQYDGRRIVSGSSDNEVKVFDASTGLEVASLLGHVNLVRTVQAGFADLPYSREEDRLLARKVDEEYFRALEAGEIAEPEHRPGRNSHPRNAGSMRPQDITAYGANLPPGGGGGKYARIVSGSYDQCVIIWRRDKDGIWKDFHRLRQDEAAAASRLPPPPPSDGPDGPDGPGDGSGPSGQSSTRSQRPSGQGSSQANDSRLSANRERLHTYIDMIIPHGAQTLEQALTATPSLLNCYGYLNQAIDRVTSPHIRNNLRQVVERALVQRANYTMARRAHTHLHAAPSTSAASQAGSSSSQNAAASSQGGTSVAGAALSSTSASTEAIQAAHARALLQQARSTAGPTGSASAAASTGAASSTPAANGGSASGQQAAAPAQSQGSHGSQPAAPAGATTAGQAQGAAAPGGIAQQLHLHHPHVPDDATPARVFKLQYDARRIICCSQTTVIVGWDFCYGDPELEAVARFFAPVE